MIHSYSIRVPISTLRVRIYYDFPGQASRSLIIYTSFIIAKFHKTKEILTKNREKNRPIFALVLEKINGRQRN
ncbi:hypothetical protein AXI59_15545 [Bacillus nakamurai]|uniref:Uncharacterized protein n=1 Tax=Bacillus nakamurai TaxID=1793963 RepID=A0A150FCH6_9BACI|nr:hypothetical protein AXI59_15545 [Bacillus nakamurai]KXZ23382.1 hypothetical protein AXI58_00235 [Bacillus nakamurai]